MFTFHKLTYVFAANSKTILVIKMLMILAVIQFNSPSLAAKPDLSVAISIDMPPYVMGNATSGLQVDIVSAALADYTVHFVQMPYGELQTAVQQKRADVSVGVLVDDSGVFYSHNFITFANVAISKKSTEWKIERVADLKNYPVLTWQNAYLDLGVEFERLFSPQSPHRKNYIEIADQIEQVQMFWQGEGNVIVIDQSIFTYLSKKMGHSMDKVTFHNLFPPVTNFKASFKDAELRDKFDQALSLLCQRGKYEQLLNQYSVKLQSTICDDISFNK